MELRLRKKKIDYSTDDEKNEKLRKSIIKPNENINKTINSKESNEEIIPGWIQHSSVLTKDFNSIISDKILAFDLDNTLITTKSGSKYSENKDDWKMIYEHEIIKKLSEFEDYKLVIFTNQLGISTGKVTTNEFELKIESIIKFLDKPFLILSATENDFFRKPSIGMWELMIEKFNEGKEPDLKNCYFIGDAAGRPQNNSKKKDHSDSDYKFALNAGIQFLTPEKFFKGESENLPFPSFDPSKLPVGEYDIKELISDQKEIILFVGSPGSGKTSFYRKYLEPFNYVHINQDTLKTVPKCMKVAEENLKKSLSVVIDSTNAKALSRKVYISLAQKNNVPIRCFYFKNNKEIVFHLNNLRDININRKHNSKSVPDVIIHTWFKYLEVPTLEEGFSEIKNIEFRAYFENENDKKLFNMFS